MTNFGKKASSISDISNLLIILAITMLGTFLRWQYLGKGDFILNDGGMFYTMILDLEKNGFALPEFTSYNISQIPEERIHFSTRHWPERNSERPDF